MNTLGPPNRKTIWSEIYNVHLCNKYHFTKFVDLEENSKPAITLGGLCLIQFKWNSLYFRSENRLMRSFIKTYVKAGELERGQNLWNQLFKILKKMEEENTLPKALWTPAVDCFDLFCIFCIFCIFWYSAFSAYSPYSPYSPYFTTYTSTEDKVSLSARVNSFNVQQGREWVSELVTD